MTIDQFNFAGKKTFVRVDFNVPVDENFNITDDTRIVAAMPTLKKIIADGGRLIIASHMGRPKKNPDPKYSLKYILKHVSECLGVDVKFAEDCAKAQEQVAALKDGEALLLENVRFYAEEEGKPRGIEKEDPAYDAAKKELKAAQKEFAKTLASYADVYVNDAFGTAHRKHATTAVMADFFDADHKMFGYLMEKEVVAVEKVLNNSVKPVTAPSSRTCCRRLITWLSSAVWLTHSFWPRAVRLVTHSASPIRLTLLWQFWPRLRSWA